MNDAAALHGELRISGSQAGGAMVRFEDRLVVVDVDGWAQVRALQRDLRINPSRSRSWSTRRTGLAQLAALLRRLALQLELRVGGAPVLALGDGVEPSPGSRLLVPGGMRWHLRSAALLWPGLRRGS